MRLKSLELHGFKSFPEKTVITFDTGATVIVGPNGSGKSNITDAMRWVLGELSSKNIRGSKMEDVIFVGADGFRPMGFAEVSVTFDNTGEENRIDSPYDEITVTRRYYRAGESEYFINRKAVRLRDIYELFMNTGIGREGYSIIGQGRIAEIISKKSDERRGIFDETAGIAKYRFKKQEAQKKLDATEANMLRVSDILSELESRVGPLEKQARKAREYLELFAQKKELDVALWLYDMQRQIAAEAKTKNDCRLSRHELEMTQDTENQLEAQSERLFTASQDTKQEAARRYEAIRTLTAGIHDAENEYRLRENDTAHANAEVDACAGEEARLGAEIAAARAAGEEHAARAAALEHTAEEENRVLDALRAERAELLAKLHEREEFLARALTEQKKHEDALLDLRVRRNVLKNTLSTQKERSGSISADMEKYKAELDGIDASAGELEESIRRYAAEEALGEKEAAEAQKQIDEAQRSAEALSHEMNAAGAQADSLGSRIAALRSMMDHFEGYSGSVRFVMSEANAGRLAGVHGPVSHLISVKPEYATALETALGAALQNIVVDDESAAKNAIYALKRAGAGRATFYPLTSVKASARSRDTEAAASYPGFVGFADALLSYDARYAGVIGSLLNRVAVFDTLDHASDMARGQGWRVRAVTLDGQQINAGGSFTGGSSRRDSGILSRGAQIDALETERCAAEQKRAGIQKQIADWQGKAKRLRAARTAAEDKQKLLATLRRADQTQLDELTARRGVIENLTAQLAADWKRLLELGERGADDIRALDAQCAGEESEIARLAEARSSADVERSSYSDRIDALGDALSEKQIRLAELKKDLELEQKGILDADALLAQQSAALESAAEKRSALTARLTELRAAIDDAKKRSAALSDELSAAEKERASLEAGGMEYEKRLNELRLRLKDISAKKELLVSANEKNENRYQQITADIEKMTQRLWDEYELTPTAASDLGYPAVEDGTRAPAHARLAELKAQIKALGSVNVAAIDEYASVKERYDFVRIQMDDLNASKEDLLGIIGSIEGEMAQMFTAAFEKINGYFGEVFRDLFGGGEAHLTLTDPENVLTSGIEISAAPPGKMIKNLALLSGGEQSVIAIALLFALVRVNPSPFCIFDEIEAALDEVNVRRVAQYVKRISAQMQIIMITHRRGTMEIADTLYGVTMPQHGVSRVFALDVHSMSDEELNRAL